MSLKKIATANGKPCSLVLAEESVANQKGYHMFECSCGKRFMTHYYAAFHVKKAHQGEKPADMLKICCDLSCNLSVLESVYINVSDNIHTYLLKNEETLKRIHEEDALDCSTPSKRPANNDIRVISPMKKPDFHHITKQLVNTHSPRTPSLPVNLSPDVTIDRFSISPVDFSPHSDSDFDCPHVLFDIDNHQLSDPRFLLRPLGSVYHKNFLICSDLPVLNEFMNAHRQLVNNKLTVIGSGKQNLSEKNKQCTLQEGKLSANVNELDDRFSPHSPMVPTVRRERTFSFKFFGAPNDHGSRLGWLAKDNTANGGFSMNNAEPALEKQQLFMRNNLSALLDVKQSSNNHKLDELSSSATTPTVKQACAFSFKIPVEHNDLVFQMAENAHDVNSKRDCIVNNSESSLASWNKDENVKSAAVHQVNVDLNQVDMPELYFSELGNAPQVLENKLDQVIEPCKVCDDDIDIDDNEVSVELSDNEQNAISGEDVVQHIMQEQLRNFRHDHGYAVLSAVLSMDDKLKDETAAVENCTLSQQDMNSSDTSVAVDVLHELMDQVCTDHFITKSQIPQCSSNDKKKMLEQNDNCEQTDDYNDSVGESALMNFSRPPDTNEQRVLSTKEEIRRIMEMLRNH